MTKLTLRLACLIAALAVVFAACPAHANDEEVDLGVITLKTRGEAESVRGKLGAGANFEELAKQVSEGPAVSRGGRVGRQKVKGLRAEYRAALAGLAPMTPSKVVPIEDGYAVLMRFNQPRAEPTAPPPSLALEPKTYYQPSIAPARPISPAEVEDAPVFMRGRRALMAALENLVVGDIDSADKNVTEARGYNPHDEATMFMQGIVDGVKSGALAKDAAVSFGDGFLAMLEGDVARAEKLFGKAAAEDPRLWQARLFEANMLAGQGRGDQARALLEALVAQKPDVAEAHLSLAMMSMAEGKVGQGKQELERALKANPNMAQALYQMGQVAVYEGDAGRAEGYFKAAIAADPYYEEAYNDLGLIYAHLGRVADAEASFNKALELNPTFFPAHIGLGNLYGRERKFNQAVDEFNQALTIDPTFAPAYYNAALAYIAMDMWAEAISYADKAASLGMDIPPDMAKDLNAHRR